jgi:hypothetical protein
MFVKEVLNDNPDASTAEVNERWRASGMSGTISSSLVSNTRTRMRQTGKLPRKRGRRGAAAGAGERGAGRRAAGRRHGRPRHQAEPAGDGAAPILSRGRERELMNLEVEIDRVLMKVAQAGEFPEVENALRKVRRQLYAGLLEHA